MQHEEIADHPVLQYMSLLTLLSLDLPMVEFILVSIDFTALPAAYLQSYAVTASKGSLDISSLVGC